MKSSLCYSSWLCTRSNIRMTSPSNKVNKPHLHRVVEIAHPTGRQRATALSAPLPRRRRCSPLPRRRRRRRLAGVTAGAAERRRCRAPPAPLVRPHVRSCSVSWPLSAPLSHCRTESRRPPLDLEPWSLAAGWLPQPSKSLVSPSCRASLPSHGCWDATAARAAVLSPPLAECCRALPAGAAGRLRDLRRAHCSPDLLSL
ncbi:hypothetical protein Scep_007977 [Stephania cephalantha]|uniref:Uncharacterized protein n=1 Tax=Stephania cephalantha TaxID=152367 RepID=A0AAP0KDJ8_9MAGN